LNIRAFLEKLANEKKISTEEDLIFNYGDYEILKYALDDANKENPAHDEQVSPGISHFIECFWQRDTLFEPAQLEQFYAALATASDVLKQAAVFAIIHAAHYFYVSCFAEIKWLRDEFKKNITDLRALQATSLVNTLSYQKFVVIYHTANKYAAIAGNISYPMGIVKLDDNYYIQYYEVISKELPYLFNLLNLLQKFEPLNKGPSRLNLQDLSPEFGAVNQVSRHTPYPYFKDHRRFIPIAAAKKIAKGDKPNTVEIVADIVKQKVLYVRNGTCRSAILASKIARRISAQNFSSERGLTNGKTASRALAGYQLSLAQQVPNGRYDYERDDNYRIKNKKPSTDKLCLELYKYKKILPGLGIIDEVCDFIAEGDGNLEDIGLSAEFKTSGAYFTRIDFDSTSPLAVDGFLAYPERNSFKDLIYGRDDRLDTTSYQREKLQTRIKLALFTKELLALDVAKSGFPESNKIIDLLEKKLAIPLAVLSNEENQISERVARQEIKIMDIYQDVLNDFVKHDSKHLEFSQCEKVVASVAEKALVLITMFDPTKASVLALEIKKIQHAATLAIAARDKNLLQEINARDLLDAVKKYILQKEWAIKTLCFFSGGKVIKSADGQQHRVPEHVKRIWDEISLAEQHKKSFAQALLKIQALPKRINGDTQALYDLLVTPDMKVNAFKFIQR